ncbi:5-bromo-4-chloroindolyl phosphate hydrolysis family protein [Kosakonia sp. Marseille-Q7440]
MGYQITYMLNKFYRNRLNRIAVQIGLFPLGFLYGGLKGKELDYLSPIIMSCEGLAWLSFILLARTLFHDRIALGAGAFAGFIWLMFRDAATMPFAAGTAAIFVHFYRNRQAPGQIHAWYLFVWYLAAAIYCDIFRHTMLVINIIFWGVLISGAVLNWRKSRNEARLNERQAAPVEEFKQDRQKTAEEPSLLDQRIYRLQNQYTLPDALNIHLTGIATLADKILQCMETDPRDVVPGRRFLERYLPLVEKIAARGQILSDQLSDEAQRQKAITELAVVLERVERAFEQQHQALLENDSLDLDAELLTIDNMLKADGFGK